MSDTYRDQAGTVFTPVNPGPLESGSPISIPTPSGSVPGHLVGGEAVPDKKA